MCLYAYTIHRFLPCCCSLFLIMVNAFWLTYFSWNPNIKRNKKRVSHPAEQQISVLFIDLHCATYFEMNTKTSSGSGGSNSIAIALHFISIQQRELYRMFFESFSLLCFYWLSDWCCFYSTDVTWGQGFYVTYLGFFATTHHPVLNVHESGLNHINGLYADFLSVTTFTLYSFVVWLW